MTRAAKRLPCLCLLTLPLVAGCFGDATQQVQEAVQQAQSQAQTAQDWQTHIAKFRALGAAMHRYFDTQNKGPASWAELNQSAGGAGFADLEQSGCVVQWGKHFRDAPSGTSEYVLAYMPAGLEKQFPALFMDGSVQVLTPDDLRTKLTAQGTPPAAPAPK